jgi:hypothetical protein
VRSNLTEHLAKFRIDHCHRRLAVRRAPHVRTIPILALHSLRKIADPNSHPSKRLASHVIPIPVAITDRPLPSPRRIQPSAQTFGGSVSAQELISPSHAVQMMIPDDSAVESIQKHRRRREEKLCKVRARVALAPSSLAVSPGKNQARLARRWGKNFFVSITPTKRQPVRARPSYGDPTARLNSSHAPRSPSYARGTRISRPCSSLSFRTRGAEYLFFRRTDGCFLGADRNMSSKFVRNSPHFQPEFKFVTNSEWVFWVGQISVLPQICGVKEIVKEVRKKLFAAGKSTQKGPGVSDFHTPTHGRTCDELTGPDRAPPKKSSPGSGPILHHSPRTEELTARSTAIAVVIDIVRNAAETHFVLHLSRRLLGGLWLTRGRL